MFEIAGEESGFDALCDADLVADYLTRLRALALETGLPVTWGTFSVPGRPYWRRYIEQLDRTAAAGGRMIAQVHSRPMGAFLSFATHLPFDRLPVWKELRRLPLSEQRERLADPALCAALVDAAREFKPYGMGYDRLLVLERMDGRNESLEEYAQRRAVHPVAALLELARDTGLQQFFFLLFANLDETELLDMVRHPRTVVTFSDSGAHVSSIADASLQVTLLSHWVRERQALSLEEAVHLLTLKPAMNWGISDRGLLRPGLAADIVVFDPQRIAVQMPEVTHDLPAGTPRLQQRSTGILATIVNGRILLREGRHTGAYPGAVLRGPLASATH
jgi:N-acyl-D-aspartate/D-glutamate deacylase